MRGWLDFNFKSVYNKKLKLKHLSKRDKFLEPKTFRYKELFRRSRIDKIKMLVPVWLEQLIYLKNGCLNLACKDGQISAKD